MRPHSRTLCTARAVLLLAALLHASSAANPCTQPKGIDDPAVAGALSSEQLNLPADMFIPALAKNFFAQLVPLETAVQFRTFLHIILPVHNFAAAFHPTAIDHFGRRDVSNRRRRCQPSTPKENSLFQLHRKVSMAYTLLFASDASPGIRGPMCEDLRRWGLSCDVCSNAKNCQSTDTPWGLAFKVVEEVLVTFASNDGWNADGSLSREYNKIPFEDWRGAQRYVPVNNPWTLKDSTRWQPLVEHTSQGFVFYQEHIVPHIGDSAVSVLLGDDEICKLQSPDPGYNLKKEAMLALKRSAQLNDRSKSEVVAFDGKLTSLIPLQVQYFQRAGISTDSWEFLFADTIVISAIYEATIVVWRQKVRHDKIRPPSLVHELLRGKKVRTYAGPGAGTRRIRAEDWEPYIRTMPHAEFPSASACFCKVFEGAMRNATGGDDVARKLGGPLALPLKAGSSPVEPGAVPKADIVLAYSKWSELTRACSQSRLNGGMHFTRAVSAGEELCAGIAGKATEFFAALQVGRRPRYVSSPGGSKRPKKSRCG